MSSDSHQDAHKIPEKKSELSEKTHVCVSIQEIYDKLCEIEARLQAQEEDGDDDEIGNDGRIQQIQHTRSVSTRESKNENVQNAREQFRPRIARPNNVQPYILRSGRSEYDSGGLPIVRI